MTADRAPLVEIVRDAIGKTQLMVPGNLRDLLCASTYANDHVIALLLKDAAKSAIDAMLDAIAEPTEAMKWAGTYKRMESRTEAATTDIWRTMFSALRKELTDD